MSSELRYCEKCGDIIKQASDTPSSIAEKFFCDKCGGQEQASPAVAATKSDLTAEPIELDNLVDAGQLSLFSKQTIEMQRNEAEGLVEEASLQLMDAPDAGGPGQSLSEEEPEIEVAEPAEPADSPLRLIDPGSVEDESAASAQTARKIIFRCVHCKASLSIKSVSAASRLTCPYCSKAIYVTASGQLSANPPSFVLREGSGALNKIAPGGVQLNGKPEADDTSGRHEAEPRRRSKTGPAPSSPAEVGRAVPAIVEKVPDSGAVSSAVGTPGRRPGSEARKRIARNSGGGSSRRLPLADTLNDQSIPKPSQVESPAEVVSSFGPDSIQLSPPRPEDTNPQYTRAEPLTSGRPVKAQGGGRAAAATGVSPISRDRTRALRSPRGEGFELPVPSFFKKLAMTTVWGIFLTLTLTGPFLILGAIHHVAGTEAQRDSKTQSESPKLFGTLGKIAEDGMGEVMRMTRGSSR